VAVALLVVLVADDADRRSSPAGASPSQPNANWETSPELTPLHEKQELNRRGVQTANKWARLFATSDPDTCRSMTQPACQREDCVRVNPRDPTPPRIKGCTPPSPEYRESFRGASVDEIVVSGRRAAARFINGEAAELFRPYSADFWLIRKFGENAGRGFFEK
jgi:hypothetical protein